MLNDQDRRAIESLFDRLRTVERKATPRDPEAERLIEDLTHRQPAAAYYMAQTILVQETALKMAEERISELERQTGRQVQAQPTRGPWDREDRSDRYARGGGTGFLAGAAQTALGVASGVLIGSAIASLLSGAATAGEWGNQPADEASADQPADEPANDAGADDGGGEASGGDFGDFGDFDVGGDF